MFAMKRSILGLFLSVGFFAFGDLPTPVQTGPSSYNINFNDPRLVSSGGLVSIDPNNQFKITYSFIANCKTYPSGPSPALDLGIYGKQPCPGLAGQTGVDQFTIFSIGQFGGPPPTDIGVLSVTADVLMSKTPVMVVNPPASPTFRTFTVSVHQDGQCSSTLPSVWTSGFTTTFGTDGLLSILLDPSQGTQSFTITCTKPMYSFKGVAESVERGTFFVDNGYLTMIQNISLTVGTNASPKLVVADVKFEQVVENPKLPSNTNAHQFDAIKGKSSSFKITLAGDNLSLASGSVVVQVRDSTGAVLSKTNPIAVSTIASEIQTHGNYTVLPQTMSPPYVPQQVGLHNITVHIEKINQSNVTTVDDTSTWLKVHQVTPPKIGIAAVNQAVGLSCPSILRTCVGSPSTNEINVVTESNQLFAKMFPVPDSSVTYSSVAPVTASSLLFFGEYSDFISLEISRQLNHLDRIVGIVSASYFKERSSEGAYGLTLPGLKTSVLVTGITPNTVLHELAHSYGQLTEGYCEEPPCNAETAPGVQVPGLPDLRDVGVYLGWQFSGYDATTPGGKSYSYPDPIVPLSIIAKSIMTGFENLNPNEPVWMDPWTYKIIENTLIGPNPPDPEVIIVSGILTQAGEFIFGPAVIEANGVLTESFDAGDVKIGAYDKNGGPLSFVKLQSDFRLRYTAGPGANISLPKLASAIPVVVSLPNNPNIDSIQVTQDEKSISKISLNSQLLLGIVSRIPDNGFRADHNETIANSRKILEDVVKRAQDKLNSKNPQSATGPLHDLIAQIRRLTFQTYTIADASQITQQRALVEVNSIIDKLQHQGNVNKDQKEK